MPTILIGLADNRADRINRVRVHLQALSDVDDNLAACYRALCASEREQAGERRLNVLVLNYPLRLYEAAKQHLCQRTVGCGNNVAGGIGACLCDRLEVLLRASEFPGSPGLSCTVARATAFSTWVRSEVNVCSKRRRLPTLSTAKEESSGIALMILGAMSRAFLSPALSSLPKTNVTLCPLVLSPLMSRRLVRVTESRHRSR